MTEYTRKVQYYETDKMSFVHHSNHIRWFEEARLDFMDKIGISYKSIEDMGFFCPVLSVECKYRKSVHFDDRIKIAVKLCDLGNVRHSFSYKITDAQSGEEYASGKTEHCFLNKEGHVISLKKKAPELFEKFLSYAESE